MAKLSASNPMVPRTDSLTSSLLLGLVILSAINVSHSIRLALSRKASHPCGAPCGRNVEGRDDVDYEPPFFVSKTAQQGDKAEMRE